MPFKLTDTDTSILKELLKDGRKSFRQITRDMRLSKLTMMLLCQTAVIVCRLYFVRVRIN